MTQWNTFTLMGSILVALIAMLCPASTRSASASTPQVRDEAHLFAPATLDQANAIVKEIREKYGKDLAVETFDAIPQSLLPGLTAEGKEAFYEHWLRREARAAETNGIFILIVKDPGRLQIGVGNQTSPKAFTFADRDELRDVMLKSFREKKFDAGLIDGAHFVLDRLGKNGAEPANNTQSSPAAPSPVPARTQPSATRPPATEPAAPGSAELNK